jgi:hypothetical protein
MDHRTAILNLIYSYSRYVDVGDFDAVGQLFEQGVYEIPSLGRELNGTAIGTYFERSLRRYEDGTPKTTHVNPNVILDIDEERGHAIAWTSVLVFQEVDGHVDCVFTGWYDDEFQLEKDTWTWKRRVTNRRLVGDMSKHVIGTAGLGEE